MKILYIMLLSFFFKGHIDIAVVPPREGRRWPPHCPPNLKDNFLYNNNVNIILPLK